MQVGGRGASVLVRVNRGLRSLAADLEVSVIAGVHGLVLPKVDSADWIVEVAGAIEELERERGLVFGAIKLLRRSRRRRLCCDYPRSLAHTRG
ncbi:aldolase/citrate lyase family protein [Mesorhizobium sp. M0522]